MDNSKLSDVNWIRVMLFVVALVLLSSCSSKLTPHQAKIDYELEKLYLEYSYERDSLIIEFYRRDVIEEDGVRWYTLDSVIIHKGKFKPCCEKTSNDVYKYEGLITD